MTFNFSETTLVEGLLAFADFPFVPVPLSPDAVVDTVSIGGSETTGGALQGSFDSPE